MMIGGIFRMNKIKQILIVAIASVIVSLCSVNVTKAEEASYRTYFCILDSLGNITLKDSPIGRAVAWITIDESQKDYVESRMNYNEELDALSVDGIVASSMVVYCAELHIGDNACTISSIEPRGGIIMTLDIADGSRLVCDEMKDEINFSGSLRQNVYTGSRKSIETAEVEIENVDGQVYTGSALTPAVQLKIGDKILTQGTDYTASYTNNVNASEKATITIKGIGDYKDIITRNFTINPASIWDTDITVGSVVYNGEAQLPTVNVKFGDTTVTTSHYTLTGKNNTAAGSKAQVIITGKGNFTGSVTKYFVIEKADISGATLTLLNGPYTYTGSAIKPSVNVTVGGKVFAASDYTVTYTNNIEPGIATVTVSASGNNVVAGKSVSKDYRILRKVPSISLKNNINSTWYNANGSRGLEVVAPSDCKGTFSFSSNNTSLLGINASSGVFTVNSKTAFGSADITITFTPNSEYSAHYAKATITHTVKVVPNIVQISSSSSTSAGQLSLEWTNSKASYNATSYRIYYYSYKDDDEKCGTMIKYKTETTTTKITLKSMNPGKYYIKVVPCYTYEGSMLEGVSMSPVKCVIN